MMREAGIFLVGVGLGIVGDAAWSTRRPWIDWSGPWTT